MSIWREILYTFGLVILVIMVLVQTIAFVVTKNRFDLYTTEEMQYEANHIARVLSAEYSKYNRWQDVDFTDYENMFWSITSLVAFDQPPLAGAAEQVPSLVAKDIPTDSDLGIASDVDLADDDSWSEPLEHIVVTDLNGLVYFDNLAGASVSSPTEHPTGIRAAVTNLGTTEPVGFVYFSSNKRYKNESETEFLVATFLITAVGALITFLIALIISLFLARKITRPVTQLTLASELLLKEYDTRLNRPTTKNEVEILRYTHEQLVETIKTQKYLRQRLLNDLSHEINTPLSVIKLEARALADGMQTGDLAAQQISTEVAKLTHLIEDLNWIAETDAGRMPLNKSQFDLIPTLRNEIARWASTAKQKDIAIHFVAHADIQELTVCADQQRLMQAFNNVLNNALYYSPEGSEIEAFVTCKETTLTIGVLDNGIGISPDDIPHVMDRFYRVDESRSRHSGGRGIGLSIVRSVVEAHQGTVNINSDGIGKGCYVELSLPISMVRC